MALPTGNAPQTPAANHVPDKDTSSPGPPIALLAAVLLAILLTAYMVAKFLSHDFKDAEVWYDAGRRVLLGHTLSGLPHYRYPPTFAVLVAPLCAAGFAPFYFLWYAMNLAFLGLSARLAQALASPLPDAPASRPRTNWLPILLVAVFAIDNLLLGQTNILIMLLVYWCFLEDSRGRQWLSGLPLGLAIAIKAFPLPLLAYFLYRRRFSLVAAGVLSCLFFLLLLPAPARGFHRNYRELHSWTERVALPFFSRGQAGDWGQHALDFGNHSFPGVAHRLLTRTDAGVAARADKPLYVNLANLTRSQVNRIVLAFYAALALAFLAASGWRPPATRRERALEYSLAVAILLLASALSWTYFFVMLLLPVTLALQLLADPTRLRRVSVWVLRVSLWALILATLFLWPAARPTQYVRALGGLCWATLGLFVGLALARWDLRRCALEPPSLGSPT